MRLAFLGPEGTFTQEAAAKIAPRAELVACSDTLGVIRAVEDGQADQGVLPIENKLQGSVGATLEALAFDSNLLIEDELELPISLVLCAQPNTTLDDITEVRSHPIALAGCREWLSAKLPNATRIAAASTAAATADAASAEGIAAIANPMAAELYGLDVLATEITDVAGNRTRFVKVGHLMRPPTGWDRTSIVAFIERNRPGALMGLLQIFAERDIDLTKIESRPTRRDIGEYCFFLDIAGHMAEARVADALSAVKRMHRDIKILGSYPRGDERIVGMRPSEETTDDAYTEAAEWIDTWRQRINQPD